MMTDIAKVLEIERAMKAMPQIEIPVRHYFSHGVYAREICIPKGTCATGKVHKFANLNILSQGELSVSTVNGVQRVKAPFTMVAPAGSKRIFFAHEDCVWTTILGTGETDPEVIETNFTADSHEDYLRFTAQIEGA